MRSALYHEDLHRFHLSEQDTAWLFLVCSRRVAASVAGTVIVFPFEHAIQKRDDGHLCVPTPLKSDSSCGRGPADTLKRFPDPGEEAPWDPIR